MAAMVQTTIQALFALVDRVSSLRLVLFRTAKSCRSITGHRFGCWLFNSRGLVPSLAFSSVALWHVVSKENPFSWLSVAVFTGDQFVFDWLSLNVQQLFKWTFIGILSKLSDSIFYNEKRSFLWVSFFAVRVLFR